MRKAGIEPERRYRPTCHRALPRPAWLRNAAELEALIERTGFTASARDIRRRAEPCLYIFEEDRALDSPVGATRFGGLPDLPPDMPWPDVGGNPLRFYAQIDLSDLAGTVIADRLPGSGLLSFFVSPLDLDPDLIVVVVPLVPDGAPLVRRLPPADCAQFAYPTIVTLDPVSVVFEPGLSFPIFDLRWLEELERANPDGDIDALMGGLGSAVRVLGQMLGYPSWTSDDLREEMYFEEIGRPGAQSLRLWTSWDDWEQAKTISSKSRGGTIYRPWQAKDDANMRWILENEAEITEGVEQWRALLSIESNAGMNLWINDANAIYFLTRAERLREGDFSAVRATTTQS
ncbi:MAG: DUF1963 domain-containing protein [Sphingomonas sp.]|jgi:hypothetical protein|uniref:DUF1963 domain-containing protein n=1 Tax=Sphingomonas sp. TaxID=28214 RepID=UPI0035679075